MARSSKKKSAKLQRYRRSILPEDLIFEAILPRLPVKSIGRFRCVSKSWNRDLSSPKFIKDNFKFHEHEPEDLIYATYFPEVLLADAQGKFKAVYKHVNHPLFKGNTKNQRFVVGSCNGLVLVLAESSLICINPITLDSLKVPVCPRAKFGSKSLAYGLGFDASTDDYKIVVLPRVENGSERFVDIFSLREKLWKRIKFPSLHVRDPDGSCGGLSFNGCIHWRDIKNGVSGSRAIIAFNLASEELEEFPIPGSSGYGLNFEIKVVEGCLAIFHVYNGVWVLNDYGVKDSWTMHPKSCQLSHYKFIYQFSEDEFVVLEIGEIHEKLLLYKPRARSVEVLEDMKVFKADVSRPYFPDILGFDRIKNMTFKRSLISPN